MTMGNIQQQVINYLLQRPLISRSGLCDIIGWDRGSLEQALRGQRPIPKKYLFLLEKELKKYGYTSHDASS